MAKASRLPNKSGGYSTRQKSRQKSISSIANKTAAQHLGLRVEQPAKAQEALAWLKDLKPDLVIVTAYGQILPSALLRLPRFGAVNLHPSLLPKYRGPSPIQTAILNGDKQTGTTLMLLNDKLDQGPILAQTKIAIAPADTYLTLSQKLAQLSIELLEKTLPLYLAGKLKPKPQKEAVATFCKMIKRQDGLIDWQKSAIEIQRQLRAFTPWPGLYTLWSRQPNRWRLKIIALSQGPATIQPAGTVFEFNKKPALACGNQTSVIINIIQPEGKREMKGEEFLRGYRDFVGSNLA